MSVSIRPCPYVSLTHTIPIFHGSHSPAFTRPNVSLVTDDISSLNKTGIVCTSGASFDVDAIVLATGFDAVANAKPFVVYGIDADTSMHAEWKEQPSAHLGVTYPGTQVCHSTQVLRGSPM